MGHDNRMLHSHFRDRREQILVCTDILQFLNCCESLMELTTVRYRKDPKIQNIFKISITWKYKLFP